MQISDRHLSVPGQAVLAAKPHMFFSWLKNCLKLQAFHWWGERKKDRERRRGREATHFFLAKFPQSLRAFALIPSFISCILLYVIKTFLKCACVHLFFFVCVFFVHFLSANIFNSTQPFFYCSISPWHCCPSWKGPKFGMVNVKAELDENLSAVCHCVRVSVLLYFISYGGDPLCVNKEHEDETELSALLTRCW